MQDTSVVNFVTPHTSAAPALTPGNDTLASGGHFFQFSDSATVNPQKSNATDSAVTYINFYSGHQLQAKNYPKEISYRDPTPDWLFYILLIVVAALAWIRYFYGKIFGQTIQAIFNVNTTNQIVRDENVLLQRTSTFLGIIFNIVFAIILYHIADEKKWNILHIDHRFGRFLFFMLAVSAVYSFKFLLLKIIGFIFSVEREMATYIFNIFLINNMLGLTLIPLAVIWSFSLAQDHSVFVITACILIGLAFIYRILRGVLIGLSYKGINLMYLFLYFCALEFAPLLVLIKFISS